MWKKAVLSSLNTHHRSFPSFSRCRFGTSSGDKDASTRQDTHGTRHRMENKQQSIHVEAGCCFFFFQQRILTLLLSPMSLRAAVTTRALALARVWVRQRMLKQAVVCHSHNTHLSFFLFFFVSFGISDDHGAQVGYARNLPEVEGP